MKLFIALILFGSLSFAEPQIGWNGDTFSAGSVVGNSVLNVTVTADDQVIDPNGYAVVNIDSDNAASAQRSISFAAGNTVGQKFRATCRPVGGNSQIDDDAPISGGGFVRLVNNWVCNQDGNSINLFWNGTDWEEDGRVNL